MTGTNSHVWPRADAGWSNDLAAWRAELDALSDGWEVSILGHPLGEPLPLWQRRASAAGAPRKLLACGFHGEEPAGPWGLLAFLRELPSDALSGVNLSLLPLVNATGFAAGTRFNRAGENPNRGFMPWLHADAISAEGRALVEHAPLLDTLAADGIMSCHEDVGVSGAYVYANEHAATPGAFSRRLRDTLARHFALHPDGEVDGCPIAEGLVFNQIDGSFEAWLFSRGAALSACIETPGLMPFAPRVAAQAAAMRAFVFG